MSYFEELLDKMTPKNNSTPTKKTKTKTVTKKKKNEEEESLIDEFVRETYGKFKTVGEANIENGVSTIFSDKVGGGGRSFSSTTEKGEEENKREFLGLDLFQKSGAWDGYEPGKVTDVKSFFDEANEFNKRHSQATLGTMGDVALNILQGGLNFAEGIGDVGGYLIAGAHDLFGADEAAKEIKKNVQQDAFGMLTQPLHDAVEKTSWLGETTDQVGQGVGQALTNMAVGAIGGAAGASQKAVSFLTKLATGTSAFGHGMSEAYKDGATDEEAVAYGAISATAEVVFEMLFSGMGKLAKKSGLDDFSIVKKDGIGLDDWVASKAGSLVKNPKLKNVVQGLVKGGFEGIEEFLTGFAQGSAKLIYEDEKTWGELLKDENLWEQFFVGMLTGDIMQAGDVAKANKSGRDLITDMTADETAVVDKIVDERIEKKAKETGKELTGKQKAEIREQAMEDLENGNLDVDDIERILGGDSYNAFDEAVKGFASNETYKEYQDALAEEKALQKEFDELSNAKATEATLGQNARFAELQQKLAELKQNSKSGELRTRLQPEIDRINQLKAKVREDSIGRLKDSKLTESYLELQRSNEKFKVDDFSKYKGEHSKQTINNILESGLMDNSNKMHKFVDFLAKISDAKGVTFSLTDAKKLAGTVHDMKGAVANAFVDGNKITLNMDSKKARQTVVGHEITHVLEGTEFYETLSNAVKRYAVSKGEWDTRLANITALYKKHAPNADPTKELVADLVGEYVFTDSKFINNLSTEHRNVFQKIYDEIKWLAKIATAGSEEKRNLVEVERIFEKAWRESNTKTDSTTKHSISEIVDENNKSYGIGVHLDSTLLDNLTPSERLGMVKEYVKELGGESFTAYDGNGNAVDITIAKSGARFRNQNGNRVPVNKDLTTKRIGNEVKQEAIALIDELVVTAEYDGSKAPAYAHGWLDNNGQNDWDYWKTYIQDKNNTIWEATLNIATTANGEKILYDISPIKKVGQAVKSATIPTANNVPQNVPGVKSQTSANDSNGNQLSNEQQDFFKDSVVRDENGNLKVMYHGTSNGGHTVFDTYGGNHGLFGVGSYFTDSKTIGESYTKKGKGKNPQVYETYLNIKNPIDMDAEANPAEWAEAFPDVGFPQSGTNEDFYRAVEQYCEDDMMPKWEAAEMIQAGIESGMGYDGITHIGGNRVNPNGEQHRVYIAFHPEQIKNTDNVNPTSDPDIRYSITEDNEGNTLTDAQQEFFKDTKAVDGNGKLLTVHHTTKNDFTVFDDAWKGEATGGHNTYMGHFFTNNPDYMSEFPEFEGGKTDAYYLNMKNPIDMNNISKEAFLDIVEVTGGDVAEAAELYDREYEAEVQRAKFRGDNHTFPDFYNLIEELTGNFYDDAEFHEVLKPNYDKLLAKGYDGFINNMDGAGWANEYIVIDSNQAKLTTNTNPTADADIRYSLSEPEVQETNDVLKDIGVELDGKSGTVSYSISSLEDAFGIEKGGLLDDYTTGEDYLRAREEYVEALVKATGRTKEECDRYLDSLFLVGEMIANDKDRLDYEAAVNKSAWVSNAEYGGSIDFSTLCAKRRLFTGTFDAIQEALPDTVLNENDFLRIRNMLLAKELESPCSMCYVEGSRAKHGEYVAKFLKDYLATNPAWKPQIADFTSSTRLEQTRINHPEAYKAYQDAMNKLAQRKPKEASVRTDYKGEILVAFEDGSSVEIKNENGGIRFNSFSDFEIIHALDCMQVLTDMARVGLNGQAYTKVAAFAEAFGNTGLKINLSLVAKDVDANGKLIYDEVNGMKYAEANDIRNRFSDNVGTVIVVFNEAQLRAALADSTIDYVLPFHRSQWKKSQYTMMGLPVNTRDFTNLQNDRVKNPKTGRPVKLSKIKHIANYVNDLTGKSYEVGDNIMPNQYWDYTKSGRENAQRYLDYINSNNLIPKFNFLLENVNGKWTLPADAVGDGYFKLLIDFKMYNNDGVGTPQNPVVPDFNMPYITDMLEKYKGGHKSFPVAHDVVNEFVEGKKSGKLSITANEDVQDAGADSLAAGKYRNPSEVGFNPFGDDIAPVAEQNVQNTADVPFDAPVMNPAEQTFAPPANTLPPTEDNSFDAPVNEAPVNDDGYMDSLVASEPPPARYTNEAPVRGDYEQSQPSEVAQENEGAKKVTRAALHQRIVDDVKVAFNRNGLDFDAVLKKAKDLSTFATVDNTPQRVMEKALGYKEGGILSDLTVNRVAQNETNGIRWLNYFVDRKKGMLAEISKQYLIEPGSKESAAAQMFAEGFYVDDNNNIVKYGDAELAEDFPNAKERERIKGLSKDPRIRWIYDDTLARINESRKRNGYPEIPRLDNYFLHFRAMEDTFSRLGLPFNPNDIRAKDLPTDLNGVTADLKPGQPYFASAMHRKGKRTSFDLLGGLERYLSSAKNQIFHIDDIQTLRALRNYIADTYGQANGLDNLDSLPEEEVQEKIEQVYNSHLSTFAKFLNEEANVLAGKTSLIDRGLEGVIGRRGITFLDAVNKQVGSNMVGFNVSSSLTNFLPVVQALAKTNKASFVKGFAQTVANKVGSIFGRGDGFTEASPVIIRRKGADRFYRTPWQKVGDAGYALMSAVDDISTELVARAKYNEFIKKGMNPQDAHIATDKWVSRLMGDRSIGQQPQLYNSKMLGLVTKFQLEVRNQLDSQFYDTIQEAKVSNEDIQNGLWRNAKTAAKIGSTFFQLAALQHLFGKAFESVAGYNPAFDIVDVLIKMFGWDDDEEDEDTVLDNIEEGFLALLEDLPYTSTFTGGRVPISSALPIKEFVTGKDQYGNEKSRWETFGEAIPYYLLPGGYGQAKKTINGLSMFDDDHPIAGSYTDSGSLRFPVEDTIASRIQAGVFGQWANENARDYIDNERTPLKKNQIQEFRLLDIPIQDYWEYREGLSGLDTLAEKADYIYSLDLPIDKKNLLINNLADRKDPINMTGYGEYGGFEEFDFAQKNPEKYDFLKKNGIPYEEFKNFDKDTKEAYEWAFDNPEKYEVAKVVSKDFGEYWKYREHINSLDAKDMKGNSVNGLKKERVIEYINGLDIDYGQKIILFRSYYPKDDTYCYDIVDYLNGRKDISYEEMVTILEELDMKVHDDGTVTWD